MFGMDRLLALCPQAASIDDIYEAVSQFCAGNPFNDDCTVLQLDYRAPKVQNPEATVGPRS